MTDFGDYLRRFDYAERKAMKIGADEALAGYGDGTIELLDIRFREEHATWRLGFGRHIPLNELPDRLGELDRGRTVVPMCPHYDRAEIARLYLVLEGYDARYLTDGMLGLVDRLRGDRARAYAGDLAGRPAS